jgi:hypothetical protein
MYVEHTVEEVDCCKRVLHMLRRMAVERARARMLEEQDSEAPVGGGISVAVPQLKPPSGRGKTLKAASKGKNTNPFGSTWDSSAGGTGWAMLEDNLLDEEPPPPRRKPKPVSSSGSSRVRSASTGRGGGEAPSRGRERPLVIKARTADQGVVAAATADDDDHLAALSAARKEAVAERRRLSLLQQQARGGGGVLAAADPAMIDALGWDVFQRMLHSSEAYILKSTLYSAFTQHLY